MQLSVEALDDLVMLINNRSLEKDKRIFLAAAAKAYGHGGEKRVKDLTGMAFSTLRRGRNDAEKELGRSTVGDHVIEIQPQPTVSDKVEQGTDESQKTARHTGSKLKDPTKTMDGRERQRKVGAGRPSILDIYPNLPDHIDALINWRAPTFGSPMGGPIRIDRAMSERKIAEELLQNWNEDVSSVSLHYLLPKLGYSKMVNQKQKQIGEESPWRNDQFLYIAETSQKFIEVGEPIISIDTKKKEKVGEFKNDGKEWTLQGLPREVLDHDFMIKELGQVAPYGVYVVNDNTGFINLGVDHDTSEFAVESIWRWWNTLGKYTFPNANQIYINCDGGGSNGATRRAWKVELQRFADKTGLTVVVSHYPPGTSKWNKVEHRMFSYISKNWAGKPLLSVETIISLIESTTTKTGLTIKCQLDTNKYELGSLVTDGMLERIKITPRPAREGENADCSKQLAKWNYTIQPRSEAEQETAKRLDKEEIMAEKTRVKRKYNKKSKESN
jgi:hypothetical protein